MDARIILAGQPVDLVGAMRQGNAAAIETNALRQNNQLTDLYRQQGAGLLAGDQGAMNALAGVDPGLAMDFKSSQQTYTQNNRKMEILNAEERRVIEDRAAAMSAAERTAAAAELESNVAMGMAIPDEATWDQTMGQVAPELVGQFGNRQALAFKYMSVADAFKNSQASDPTEGAPANYMWADPNNRGAGVVPLPGVETKPADDYGRYVQEETAAGRQPLDRISFAQALKGKGTSLSVDPVTGAVTFSQGGAQGAILPVGQNPAATATPRDDAALAKKLSEADAAVITSERERARSAEDLVSLAEQMKLLAPQLGYTGPGGGLYGAVDDLIGVLPGDSGARGGFKPLSVDAQLTFTSKTKGAITEREMALFRSAVPSLSQTPEANRMIADVLIAGAERVKTRSNFIERYAGVNGTLEGATEAWQSYIRDNPIMAATPDGGITLRAEGDWSGYLQKPAAQPVNRTPVIVDGFEIEEIN